METPYIKAQLIIKTFRKEDSLEMFAKVLALRTEVFVQEQQVPLEEEQDEYDDEALHWLITHSEILEPVATGRMYSYQEGCQMRPVAKIGRFAIKKAYRGQKIGMLLMEEILKVVRSEGYDQTILDSQVAVVAFYKQFGFETEGNEFMDANIPHYRMRLVL